MGGQNIAQCHIIIQKLGGGTGVSKALYFFSMTGF